MGNKILVTGSAGFIGFHVVDRLLKEGCNVIGLDSVNSYYDVQLKFDRLAVHGINLNNDLVLAKPNALQSDIYPEYKFYCLNLESTSDLDDLFEKEKPDIVINLAAQAGVRYSITNPREYIKSNIDGFLNILENCRNYSVKHLIYASSSSVYGLNSKIPFRSSDSVDHPISLYAATKKSNEMMAHTYSYLFNLPTTGLRFFTVYGPWGRPDMAIFLFTKAIINDKPIQLFNNGEMIRDFTFIDDIVESIIRLIEKPPSSSTDQNLLNQPNTSISPFRILNIGNNEPVILKDFLEILQNAIGKKAIIENKPIQPGDVMSTHADINELISLTGYTPNVSIEKGIEFFVKWYKEYYNI